MIDNYVRYVLYGRYCQEMTHIGETPFYPSNEEAMEAAQSFMNNEHIQWIDLKQGDLFVGFLIIGSEEECHPLCDYFIVEAYVEPAFRGRGIMRKAVQDFIKEHGGDYVLFVLKKNLNAEAFWRKTFEEMGYEENVKLPVLKGTLDTEIGKQIGFWNRHNKLLKTENE